MKHLKFACLGNKYPFHLEARYERILIKIEELWDTDEIDNFFSDLLIDKRGGRQGFPKEVLQDILELRDLRESTNLSMAESREVSVLELERRGMGLNKEHFFQSLLSGDQALVDLYIRANFNIHITDDTGNSPLLIALKKGYTVIAQILLNAGADVNASDKIGLTPLLLTCGKPTRGYKAIAETLIKKGAMINVRDRLGYTPLLLSLSGGTADIAAMLILRGADTSARTRDGKTALDLAQTAGNKEVVDLLLSMSGQ